MLHSEIERHPAGVELPCGKSPWDDALFFRADRRSHALGSKRHKTRRHDWCTDKGAYTSYEDFVRDRV